MFEKESILTLADNNKYTVVDQFNYNGKNYIYLIDINNNKNIIFGKLENDEIIELSDPDEIEEVIQMINNNLHNN